MKKCPFCKNTIAESNDTCPHCQRVLVERIYSNSTFTPHTANQNSKASINKKYFEQLNNKLKKFKLNDFKKYIPILALLFLIVFIGLQKEKVSTQTNYNPTPVSVIPNNENTSVKLSDIPAVKAKDPKTYISLSNGTVLSKNSYYLKGLGQLEINNGTSLDAIAKLVNISTNKSIFTVYVKANSVYSINKISDGNYKLLFNLGNDWDKEIKAFAINSSYEVFEESFDFTTSDSYYSTFSVTLNPVVGGQAKTEKINPTEFGSY